MCGNTPFEAQGYLEPKITVHSAKGFTGPRSLQQTKQEGTS